MVRGLVATAVIVVMVGLPCGYVGYSIGYKHAQVNDTVNTATSILNPMKWFGGGDER